jgi:hypothetical protein
VRVPVPISPGGYNPNATIDATIDATIIDNLRGSMDSMTGDIRGVALLLNDLLDMNPNFSHINRDRIRALLN